MKCGVAVVRRVDNAGEQPGFETVHRAVVIREEAGSAIRELSSLFSPDAIVIGDGTAHQEYVRLAEDVGSAPVYLVDETLSTQQARKLYFQHNPPRGIRRLIPISMQTPDRPYDDFVAVILAERFLSGGPSHS